MKQRARRRSCLTVFAQRLTPREVATHWFRRGEDYGVLIRGEHPDFPPEGPDGLYLLDDVRTWFDRYHGKRQGAPRGTNAEQEALNIARYGRRQDPASAH